MARYTHWIVVADTARARVFRSEDRLDTYTLVHEVRNPQVHPEGDELGPRGATRAAPGMGHARFDRHTDPQDAERNRFARELARTVDDAFAVQGWDGLVLVAPPAFLGDLRRNLSERALRAVVGSVDRDFTHVPERELPESVRRHLA